MTKVLVIDDSAFFRKVLRGFLEEDGFQVDDFEPLSALEVLERARAFLPDLVVTDYTMPYVDGLAVLRMIRRHGPSLPVVVLTAYRDPQREARLREHAPVWVLHKPMKGEDIVKAVKGIVAGPAPGPAPA
ncbi:response regulator [Mesoterricola silvestris]|uniref:Response regulator n=1 Tax=Mesoterricola silvestris TaxID=2927979 RepID=A0AA48K9B8_9BACT|nr:response regulator [Mesoterricola silvestris]BDU73281.1 response regulator [Mesoterricola silvestris]